MRSLRRATRGGETTRPLARVRPRNLLVPVLAVLAVRLEVLQAGDDDAANVASLAARELADKYDLCDLVPMVVVYATSAVMSARYGDADTTHTQTQQSQTRTT